MNKIVLILALATSLFTSGAMAQEMKDEKTKVSLVFDHELPNVPGKSMRVVLVDYGRVASDRSKRVTSHRTLGTIGAAYREVNACQRLSAVRRNDEDARARDR